ncbi:MAG: NAD(P)H-hydrate dehydratase [Bacteroidia bacterium]|nr:NAD(P)H-hydrate dehydratase [Bacteroidia bacterium]
MMKIFRSEQIRGADAYTIRFEPISSLDLMERAATRLSEWLMKKFGQSSPFLIFAGPGNNGGDALVVARLLTESGYNVKVYIIKFTDKFSTDFTINLERLKNQGKVEIIEITDNSQFSTIQKNDIIIDGLFGSGLARPLDGLPALTVQHINQSGAIVVAIDIPSGLFGEDNSKNIRENIIHATYTLIFQFPKLAFFFSENEAHVGEWCVIPIGLHPDFIKKEPTNYYFTTKEYIQPMLKTRKKFSHKGDYGHALLISGGYGKMGAAVLGAKACLRTGAGLTTVHIPVKGYEIIQTAVPECMVSIDADSKQFSKVPELKSYTAFGIGPGIGTSTKTANGLYNFLENVNTPVVFDADAINILAQNKEWLKKVPAGSIFTPHPKEFERLFGKTDDNYSRNQLQIKYSKEYNIYIVLKGAYTAITCPDGTCWFNTTGNPGMATAGSGDVLTGVILSLLAQGYSPKEAAILGVYLHGLAGDIAASKIGQEALIAGDIIDNLGNAVVLHAKKTDGNFQT